MLPSLQQTNLHKPIKESAGTTTRECFNIIWIFMTLEELQACIKLSESLNQNSFIDFVLRTQHDARGEKRATWSITQHKWFAHLRSRLSFSLILFNIKSKLVPYLYVSCCSEHTFSDWRKISTRSDVKFISPWPQNVDCLKNNRISAFRKLKKYSNLRRASAWTFNAIRSIVRLIRKEKTRKNWNFGAER